MTERDVNAFLAGTEWASADVLPLAGDASNRRYLRLRDPATGATAVLMDAPPDTGEDVRPFIAIADHLLGLGLSAPRIMASDADTGYLLLEDLGDALYARQIEAHPADERPLYEAATDLLVTLHDAPTPRLARYGPGEMTELATLAYTKYAAGVTGAENPEAADRLRDRLQPLLHQVSHDRDVLVLRDYHAENLIWLPERTGVARVGLLDFQDAMSGHAAYDLVSLLQDARRDVPAGIEAAMLARFVTATGVDDHGFRIAYAAMGAQRHLRVLGVFARLATDYGKPHYVDLIPRVWDHLMRQIEHPALAALGDLVTATLPAPTPDALDRLRRR